MGRFFAARFRSGVLYPIHERTGNVRALEEARNTYRRARAMWARVAERAKGVYAADLSASDRVSERGQWADRLPAIDQDIALLAAAPALPRWPQRGARSRAGLACANPNEAVELQIAVKDRLASARLYYRHVNQAERYRVAEMEARDNVYRARIPAAYTGSPYPLQYYFELKAGPKWLVPGFAPDLSNQPYFVLRSSVTFENTAVSSVVATCEQTPRPT